MTPTQEQVIAWAREAGLWPAVTDTFPSEAERFATLAYEAGRKDENEACAEMIKNWNPEFFEYMTQEYAVHFIRARREQ